MYESSNRQTAKKIVGLADMLSVSIYDFIEFQFRSMPEKFCKRIFKVTYPPFNVLCGKNSEQRCRDAMWVDRPVEIDERGMAEILDNDRKLAKSVNEKLWPIAILNKTLSNYWLAYMFITNRKKALQLCEDIGYNPINLSIMKNVFEYLKNEQKHQKS